MTTTDSTSWGSRHDGSARVASPSPSAVLEDAKLRARRDILFRAIIPFPGDQLFVFNVADGGFLYGYCGRYFRDEAQAIAVIEAAS